MGSPSGFVVFESVIDELAHDILLLVDVPGRIHRNQAIFLHDLVVLRQDAGLKDAKAFGQVVAQVHVHAGFVILELSPGSSEEPRDGDLDWYVEVKGHIGLNGETVQLADPFGRDAANDVACKGGVHVAVGKDEHSGFQRRQNFMIEPAGKVGGVEQTERRGGEAFGFFAFLRGVLDQVGGIPFREKNFVAFRLEPLVQQQELGAFSRPVDALHDDEFSRVGMGRCLCRCVVAHAASSWATIRNCTFRRNTRSKRSARPLAAQISI